MQDTAVCAGLGQFLGLWLVAFTLRLFPIVKNVVVNVGHQTQTQGIPGMVEDDTRLCPRIDPKAPANFLDVQHLGTCGGSVDNTAHGPVYPRGQLPDRTGNLDFARPEVAFQLGHFHAVGFAIHIPRRNTRSLKLSLQLCGMGTVDPEHQRGPAFALFQPGIDDVGNNLVLAHDADEVILHILASTGPDTAQVRHMRGKHREFRQVIALDQVTNRGRDDQPLPVNTQPFRPRGR